MMDNFSSSLPALSCGPSVYSVSVPKVFESKMDAAQGFYVKYPCACGGHLTCKTLGTEQEVNDAFFEMLGAL